MVSYVIEVEEVAPKASVEPVPLTARVRSASGASSAGPAVVRIESMSVPMEEHRPQAAAAAAAPPQPQIIYATDPSPELMSLRMEVENLKRAAGLSAFAPSHARPSLPPATVAPSPLLPRNPSMSLPVHDPLLHTADHALSGVPPPILRTAPTPTGLPAQTAAPPPPPPRTASVVYTPPQNRPSIAALGSLLSSAPPALHADPIPPSPAGRTLPIAAESPAARTAGVSVAALAQSGSGGAGTVPPEPPPATAPVTARSVTPLAALTSHAPPPVAQVDVNKEMLRQQEKEIMTLEAENELLKKALDEEAQKRNDMQSKLAPLVDMEERLRTCEEDYVREKREWLEKHKQLAQQSQDLDRLNQELAQENEELRRRNQELSQGAVEREQEVERVKQTSDRYQGEIERLEAERETTRERVGKYEADTLAWQNEVKGYLSDREGEYAAEIERLKVELRAMFKAARDMENRAIRAEEELHVRRVLAPGTPAAHQATSVATAGGMYPQHAPDEADITAPPCRKLPESSSHLVILQDDLTKAVHRLREDVDSLSARPEPATVHEALEMYRKARASGQDPKGGDAPQMPSPLAGAPRPPLAPPAQAQAQAPSQPAADSTSPAGYNSTELAAIRAAAHERTLPRAPRPPGSDADSEQAAQEVTDASTDRSGGQ